MGWASEVMIRIRFRRNRRISRFHTTFAACRSSSQVAPCGCSVTGATSAITPDLTVVVAVVLIVPFSLEPWGCS